MDLPNKREEKASRRLKDFGHTQIGSQRDQHWAAPDDTSRRRPWMAHEGGMQVFATGSQRAVRRGVSRSTRGRR